MEDMKALGCRTANVITRVSEVHLVVIDNGRVVETGNHESLLAAKGRYYELYMTQFAGKAI